jgi:hypothetical protein
VDAVSSNLNASWNDGSFARFYLETLHRLAAKPVLIGEFYMSARDNRSGNKNNRGLFPVVATQKERAAGFRNTLQTLLRIPYVIGADWFQYYDEPTHGRFDGENFNFGLVDIHDRPYEALTRAASTLDLVGLKSRPAMARSPLNRTTDKGEIGGAMAFLRGNCMCGAVAWTYSEEITRNLVCHCIDCQRATSAPLRHSWV